MWLAAAAAALWAAPVAAQHEEHGELHHQRGALPDLPPQSPVGEESVSPGGAPAPLEAPTRPSPAREEHGGRERHATPAGRPASGSDAERHGDHPGHAVPTERPAPETDAERHGDHERHATPAAHGGHTAQEERANPEAAHHAHHNMQLDATGMVMNHNPDRLPRDCDAISGEVELRVLAGREFAAGPGLTWGYDDPVWEVEPCSKVNVTLENRDAVRHQWMVHGLPRYLYPMGMFTIEVNGPGTRSASLIVPSGDQTFLVHCDVPHHMEKGMKGQLVVGDGSGTLPSVPGVSAPLFADPYPTRWTRAAILVAALAIGIGLTASVALRRG